MTDCGSRDAGVLWNAAEAAERRGDAQVARELVLALPANPEIGPDDRIELTRSFAQARPSSGSSWTLPERAR